MKVRGYKRLKQFIKGMFDKPHFWKRFFMCLISVTIMGFCVSWLSFIELGTDPCSLMNFGISKKLGMSFGNWQALLNTVLFIIVVAMDKSQIGIGTVFNMFIVGYSCDFMTWFRRTYMGGLQLDTLLSRVIVMIVLLFIFVFAVSIYMTVELGTAPYDALSIIVANKQNKLSFRVVRVIWDVSVTIIGVLAGEKLGIVTVLMAFSIGPAAAWVGKRIQKYIA